MAASGQWYNVKKFDSRYGLDIGLYWHTVYIDDLFTGKAIKKSARD